MGVVIHPELYFEILRPMMKKLAQSDLPYLSYGKKIYHLFAIFQNVMEITVLWS